MAFQRVKNFFYKHKNKFIISGAIVTGTIIIAKYGQKKIKEWQEKETREFLERVRKQQHFESTERTCNQTIQSLSLSLLESLQRTLNTDECIMELKNGTSDKVQVWEKLKIMIFTRLSTLVYVSAMLTVTLRIQLNLIGGYLFRDSQNINSTLQQNYLSICHSLLDNGVQKLSTLIHRKTFDIIAAMDLKRRLTLYDIEQIFWALQAKLGETSDDPIQNMKDYIISEEIVDSNEIYNNMVRETADLLESEEVRSLVTSCVNCGFSIVIDKLTEFYAPNVASEQPSGSSINSADPFVHPLKIQIPLAKLIPILNTFLTNRTLSESLFQQYIIDQKLKTLGANIYEAFSNN